MAENRYIKATVENKTGDDLSVIDSHLTWGKWVDTPGSVPAHGEDKFKSSGAAGSATGTEGWVKYSMGDTGDTVTVRWDIPYMGSNTFSISCSNPNIKTEADGSAHCNGCGVSYTVG